MIFVKQEKTKYIYNNNDIKKKIIFFFYYYYNTTIYLKIINEINDSFYF